MTPVRLSPSLNGFKAIGANQVLEYLRQDLRSARTSLFVVGPWIDGYFIQELTAVLPSNVRVQFLVRPAKRHTEAIAALRPHISSLEAKSLPTLHAKVIVIDNKIVYLGSTNWYKYSLKQALEITLRGPLSDMLGLNRILEAYWNQAKPINLAKVKIVSKDSLPIIEDEILDPYAREALQENPKAWIKYVEK
jgi:hypothetical protein